jgi:thioredoxin 1
MPLLTTDARDAGALADALARPGKRTVLCLCAAWCDTCEAFRLTFARLADADPDAAYVWIDIEDDSALVGDVDVENFPTLAVFRDGGALFYGVTPPQEGLVARTLSAVAEAPSAAPGIPAEVLRMRSALLAWARRAP